MTPDANGLLWVPWEHDTGPTIRIPVPPDRPILATYDPATPPSPTVAVETYVLVREDIMRGVRVYRRAS